MHSHKLSQHIKRHRFWIIGFAALVWLVLRSGANPKRLTYPCQRAAMPLAAGWLLAIAGFLGGSIALRKYTRISGIAIIIAGIIWFVGTLPEYSGAAAKSVAALPYWEVPNPVSQVFALDSIPATTGSLAAGDASVPDAYLSDPAMDSLFLMMEAKGTYIHKTQQHSQGIVGPDNVVVIKGNFQWYGRVSTNTDRIKGLIWKILNHPDGFTGEILVCDNTQSYAIDANDNNSQDPSQSILSVVSTFRSKGYPVYILDWKYIFNTTGLEYSSGDYHDAYMYDPSTKISYPKFLSPSGKYQVSLRYGIWDSTAARYDSSRLCIINFPVLKHHGMAGATIAVKNWIGVMTTAYNTERYGSWNAMHYTYLFTPYALVARIMAVTYPRLSIVDATWTSYAGNTTPANVINTNVLLASTDPVSVSWYAAKYVLTPISYPLETDPDLATSKYHVSLSNWAAFLHDSANYPCTMDSAKISVFGRGSILPASLPLTPSPFSPPRGSINQPVDAVLRWYSANGATSYRLQVSLDSSFATAIIDEEIYAETSKAVSGLSHGLLYFWRVKSINGSGESNWSLKQNFTTVYALNICVATSWNIVSLPALVADHSRKNLFPGATSKAFLYIPWIGYRDRDSLEPGAGYWLKFDSVQTYSFNGTMIKSDTLALTSGWNLIGSVADPIDVRSVQFIPPDIIHSNFFGYQGSYSAEDTLLPCLGYWIKVNTDGQLILPAPGTNAASKIYATLTNENLNSLRFKSEAADQTLYFGARNELSPITSELPPIPPEGAFDVRFGGNQMFAQLSQGRPVDVPINIHSSHYPITISWSVKGNEVPSVLKIDGKEIPLEGTGSVEIQNPPGISNGEVDSRVVLGVPGSPAVPTNFVLEQNFPNPFNPSTIIRYQLPLEGNVMLRIYDAEGRVVRTLIDRVEGAGYRAVEWNARNDAGNDISSGIYFCTIELKTPEGSGAPLYLVKKMMVLR